jgi:hypothetical protein
MLREVVNKHTSLYSTASITFQSHQFLATLCKRDKKQQKAAENYKDELHELYSSTNTVWVIKPQRIRQAVYMVFSSKSCVCVSADIYTQDFDDKTSRNTYGRITLQRTSGIR